MADLSFWTTKACFGRSQVDLGGGPEVGGISEALVFPGCADFHPLLFLNGLAEAVVKHGGKIYEHSRVMQTKGKKVRTLP